MIPNNFPFPHSGQIEIFDYFESATIANGATGVLINRKISEQVKKAWITQLGLGIDNPAAFQTTVWQVRVSTAPNFYYADIRDELGPFDDPRDIAPIPLFGGQTIDIFVTNNGAAPRLYAGRLRGFLDYAG
jgi:hypothetical protein